MWWLQLFRPEALLAGTDCTDCTYFRYWLQLFRLEALNFICACWLEMLTCTRGLACFWDARSICSEPCIHTAELFLRCTQHMLWIMHSYSRTVKAKFSRGSVRAITEGSSQLPKNYAGPNTRRACQLWFVWTPQCVIWCTITHQVSQWGVAAAVAAAPPGDFAVAAPALHEAALAGATTPPAAPQAASSPPSAPTGKRHHLELWLQRLAA